MAKKETVVKLSEQDVDIVDTPFILSTQASNLKLEFEAARAGLLEYTSKLPNEPGTNIRLVGKVGSALVNTAEEFVIDVSKPEFTTVAEAVEKGQLQGVVTKTVSATITPSMLQTVLKAIEAAGIDLKKVVTVSTSYSVDPDGYRQMQATKTASPELAVLASAVSGVVRREEKTRVTFKTTNKE